VGDTARELTYRLELLRLKERFLGAFQGKLVSRRSVMSRVIWRSRSTDHGAVIASRTTCAQKRLPSLRTRQPSLSYLFSFAAVCSARMGWPEIRSSWVKNFEKCAPTISSGVYP